MPGTTLGVIVQSLTLSRPGQVGVTFNGEKDARYPAPA
jgi:hypothetical protein